MSHSSVSIDLGRATRMILEEMYPAANPKDIVIDPVKSMGETVVGRSGNIRVYASTRTEELYYEADALKKFGECAFGKGQYITQGHKIVKDLGVAYFVACNTVQE